MLTSLTRKWHPGHHRRCADVCATPDHGACARVRHWRVGDHHRLEIVAAIRLRDYISNEWLMGLSGAASILFGALVIAQPGPGSVALVYLFGFYAILAVATQIAFGFRLRSLGESLRPTTQQVTSTSASR